MFDLTNPDVGYKLKNQITEWTKGINDADFNKITDEIYTRMGFIKTGIEKFLGKDCTVCKGEMGKVLRWNGIMMFMETDLSDITTKQEAISIKANVPVDKKFFELPTNIKFSEMPESE